MRIGVPKEIKPDENRVALVPAGVKALVNRGHQVIVETQAGAGSAFSDDEYRAAGAEIVPSPQEVYAAADMILKVKEPQPAEYPLLRSGQILFTYLHLAPEKELTLALMRQNVTAIAYETVQETDGSLPLLQPMSEVAGRMAPQVGAHFLEKPQGGRGVLLAGVPGVPPGEVVIIGGGTVGTNAARVALGLGAQVVVIDINPARLAYIDEIFGGRVVTLMSNEHNIAAAVRRADILIGAVLIPGAKAPHLVTDEMVKTMKPGSVIVDVAIDQGGSVATIDHITTHTNPTYVKYGVVHYAVANMPGAVPRTSTLALTNATLRHAIALADRGLDALKQNPALARGVNVIGGKVTYKAVADAHGLPYYDLASVL